MPPSRMFPAASSLTTLIPSLPGPPKKVENSSTGSMRQRTTVSVGRA